MSSRRWLPYVLIGVLAAGPRLRAAWRYVSFDEALWMTRSERFSDAFFSLEPSGMTASTEGSATMPGIVTLWVGTAARVVSWGAEQVGLLESSGAFGRSWPGLGIAQVIIALLNSALIVAFFFAMRRWVGDTAAWVAAGLVATEPFIVGLGAMLHVDSLSTLFATVGVITLAWALGVPQESRRPDRPVRVAAVAGVLVSLGVLTKLSAASFLAFAAVVAAVAAVRAYRAGEEPRRRFARELTAFAVGGLVTVPLAYPALWADPVGQFEVLRTSASIGSRGHAKFWFGELTESVGPVYYAVVLPFRMTAWFSVAAAVAVPVALWHRGTRSAAAIVLIGIAPTVLVLSFAAKQLERYGLPVLVCLAILVGLAASAVLDVTGARLRTPWLGAAAVVVVGVHALVVAPVSVAFYNPILGGGPAAEEVMTIGGGGLGINLAGERIRGIEGGDCDGVETSFAGRHHEFGFPCLTHETGTEPDYMLVYISDWQRWPERQEAFIERAELVDVVVIRGLEYVRIYRF